MEKLHGMAMRSAVSLAIHENNTDRIIELTDVLLRVYCQVDHEETHRGKCTNATCWCRCPSDTGEEYHRMEAQLETLLKVAHTDRLSKELYREALVDIANDDLSPYAEGGADGDTARYARSVLRVKLGASPSKEHADILVHFTDGNNSRVGVAELAKLCTLEELAKALDEGIIARHFGFYYEVQSC